MKIVIHRGELSPYEEATHLSVDYRDNSLMGKYKGKQQQVYNFSHICRLNDGEPPYSINEDDNVITIEFVR